MDRLSDSVYIARLQGQQAGNVSRSHLSSDEAAGNRLCGPARWTVMGRPGPRLFRADIILTSPSSWAASNIRKELTMDSIVLRQSTACLEQDNAQALFLDQIANCITSTRKRPNVRFVPSRLPHTER